MVYKNTTRKGVAFMAAKRKTTPKKASGAKKSGGKGKGKSTAKSSY